MTKALEKVYVLRTCKSDMSSHNGFKWPSKGFVKCPDWDPKPECGNGLHGFLWGVGDSTLANWNDSAKWLVVEVFKKDIIDLDGKVKFPKGKVVYCGDRKGATDFLLQFEQAKDKPIMGCYKIGGDRSILTGGDRSTLIGGYNSTLIGGDYSILTGGDYSILTGDYSTLTGGDYSTLNGGNHSTLIGGKFSTLTGADYSILTAGDRSTLSWKIFKDRYRIYTFYVGENGIEPYIKYKCTEDGKIEKV